MNDAEPEKTTSSLNRMFCGLLAIGATISILYDIYTNASWAMKIDWHHLFSFLRFLVTIYGVYLFASIAAFQRADILGWVGPNKTQWSHHLYILRL